MDGEMDADGNIGSTNTRPSKRTTTASERDSEANISPWKRNLIYTFGATENNSNMNETPPPHTTRAPNDPGVNTDGANRRYITSANKEQERLENQREKDRAAANKNRGEIASSTVYNREYIRHAKKELERLKKQRGKDQAATNKNPKRDGTSRQQKRTAPSRGRIIATQLCIACRIHGKRRRRCRGEQTRR